MINDIKALTSDGALLMASELQVPICLMHMQGDPLTMQDNPHYSLDIVHEINQFFLNRIAACEEVGIPRSNLMIDPGFGFGKTHGHNLKLLISSVLTFVVPFLKYAVAVIDALTRKLALYVLSSNKATLGYKISSLPE